jgi:tryptophan-rich sensory protein
MSESSKPSPHWAALALLAGGTAAAALVAATSSVRAGDFYQPLAKPAWAPPAQVFGPGWTVLYVLMALAAWLVVRARGWPRAGPAMALYALQLVLNALWTWLFFRWRMGSAAFAEILALAALLLLITVEFWRARRLAGALLLPYLLWVAYASALTYAVWRRNPGVL